MRKFKPKKTTFLRQCKRCCNCYHSEYRRSKICPKCTKPSGKGGHGKQRITRIFGLLKQ